MMFMPTYYARSKDKLSIDKVNVASTKRRFFYKWATHFYPLSYMGGGGAGGKRGLHFLMIVYNVIPVSYIVLSKVL